MNIKVSKDFSKTPFGRYKSDGPSSGEKFRDDFLIPLLKNNKKLIIDFSDIEIGISSAFLEEAFGGLIRSGFSKEEVKTKIEIIDDNGFYVDRIMDYIS